jgi:hypothetical protein
MGFFRRKGDEYHRIIFYWGFPKTRLLLSLVPRRGIYFFVLKQKRKQKIQDKTMLQRAGPGHPRRFVRACARVVIIGFFLILSSLLVSIGMKLLALFLMDEVICSK